MAYRGGVETMFKRAESAANFGREIGLQYVHAHLRYAEAMAALGDAEALWRALQVVNPVALARCCRTPCRRQANAYFQQLRRRLRRSLTRPRRSSAGCARAPWR
ncbi:MAG: hypothetical protein WDO13_09825 [Verrucomicrobiota bacterium]